MAAGDAERYRQFAGPIADESDLVVAFRARIEELNISRAEIDAELGLTGGYSSKRLTLPKQTKYYSPAAFWDTAELLGLAVVLVEDPHARARYASRMKRRSRPQAITGTDHWRHAKALGIVKEVARKTGSIGGKMKFYRMGKRQLRKHQQRAAIIRWERVKAAVKR